MKKQLVLLTIAILSTISITFAQDVKPVPAHIEKELNKEFKNATNLQWKPVDQFYKATFSVDGTQLEAFYNIDAKLTALSRRLTVDQLPLALMKEVKEKAAKYAISDLFELLTDKGTEYFLVVKDGTEIKKYRSESHHWTRF